MKKTIISIIVSLVVAATAQAQTNHYPKASGIITKSGYSYKYRNEKLDAETEDPYMLELYNAANRYVDVEDGYKDGTEFSTFFGEGRPDDFSSASQTVRQTMATVDGCFTSQQKTMLKGKLMFITVRFDSSTGKLTDVYFTFPRDEPFMNIPVETYRAIEIALKQNFSITPTAEGRRLKYIQKFWTQRF